MELPAHNIQPNENRFEQISISLIDQHRSGRDANVCAFADGLWR